MPSIFAEEPTPSMKEKLPIDDETIHEHWDDPNCEDGNLICEGWGGADFDASLNNLCSTVDGYYFENGRRYHAYREGSYWGPNDELDIYHQEVTHHLYRLVLDDELYLAPVSAPRNVLDIGTGRGLWPIDFADRHPDAKVIGTDLSPEWTPVAPPNVRFEVDDCCSPWTYPENSFDLVHTRGLYGSVSDWSTFYKECYNHIKPGGYIEQAEIALHHLCDDGTLSADSVYSRWANFSKEWEAWKGISLLVTDTMKEAIIQAGFEDVVEKRFKIPIGPWSPDPRLKEIGWWYRHHWETGMEGWALAPAIRHLGWSVERVDSLLRETAEAMYDSEMHVYSDIVIVYGRKPLGVLQNGQKLRS